jgi:hypothetical protein
VTVGADQELAYRSLVAIGWGEAEGGDDPFGTHREGDLEAVDPFGLGDAPAEGGLPGEEALAASADPHDRWDQGGVHHVVCLRAVGQRGGQVALRRTELRFEGTDAAVELAVGEQVREAGSQVRVGEAEEVSLAAEPRPLRDDRQRENLAFRERLRTTGPPRALRVLLSPPVVH